MAGLLVIRTVKSIYLMFLSDFFNSKIEQFNKKKNDDYILNPRLRQILSEYNKTELDLAITTRGTQTNSKSKGTYKRDINGWKPTSSEIETLATFGTITNVSSIGSTQVILREVKQQDLPEIASLEFVLEMNWEPKNENIVEKNVFDETVPQDFPEDAPTKDEVRQHDYIRYDTPDIDIDISSDIRIGILDSGYWDDTRFTKHWAGEIGIDENLATSFGTSDDWDEPSASHGTIMADTIAYMIGENNGHSNLFVPIHVRQTIDDLRDAITYAYNNDIDVLNMSFKYGTKQEICPSWFCNRLSAYGYFGYIPCTSAGTSSGSPNIGVSFPGGEWVSVGMGIAREDCDSFGDYRAHSEQNHDDITFAENNDVYCTPCFGESDQLNEDFTPDAYGHGFVTDADLPIGSTSSAAAQASAVAAVMQDNGLYDFGEAKSIFQNFSHHRSICPPSKSLQGQLIDAEWADTLTS